MFFKSTDGDKGVSAEHNKFYSEIMYNISGITSFSRICEKTYKKHCSNQNK